MAFCLWLEHLQNHLCQDFAMHLGDYQCIRNTACNLLWNCITSFFFIIVLLWFFSGLLPLSNWVRSPAEICLDFWFVDSLDILLLFAWLLIVIFRLVITSVVWVLFYNAEVVNEFCSAFDGSTSCVRSLTISLLLSVFGITSRRKLFAWISQVLVVGILL